MPAAASLKDLLIIRQENSAELRRINSGWGTALGLKNDTDPAILVFVERKIDKKWLPAQDVVPPTLKEPGGLSCPTDVVQAEFYDPPRSPEQVLGNNLDLRDKLWGASDKIRPGSQLAYWQKDGISSTGTLACFVRDRLSGKLGMLTNYHVGEYVGNVTKHPDVTSRPIGVVRKGESIVNDELRFPGIVDERDAYYKIDAAYIELLPDLDPSADIDTQLSFITRTGQPETGPLGRPLVLDLITMEPIGKVVLGVGSTRGCHRGKIFAFAYEWTNDDGKLQFTDYLIANDSSGQFGGPGDSGKLIVTDDDNRRPVALFWGGNANLRARHGQHAEDWSHAVDINLVLDRLDLDIVS